MDSMGNNGYQQERSTAYQEHEDRPATRVHEVYDVAIVGAGAAGTSAAVFTARSGRKTLVVDAGETGVLKAKLYNHVGFDKVYGPEFFRLAREQAANAGAEVVQAKVVALRRDGGSAGCDSGEVQSDDPGTYVLQAEDGREFRARWVILCTGRWLELARQAGIVTVPGREHRYPEVIQVDAEGRTNLPRVWAAGAVAGASPHTIVVAGDGARVALNLLSDIRGERVIDHDVLPAKEAARLDAGAAEPANR